MVDDSITGLWPLLIFGWPLLTLALASYIGAIVFKRAWMAVAGAALAVPFCLYIAMHSRAAGAALLLSNLLAAWLLRRGSTKLAVLVLVPFVLLIAALAMAVVRSN